MLSVLKNYDRATLLLFGLSAILDDSVVISRSTHFFLRDHYKKKIIVTLQCDQSINNSIF